MSLDSSISEQTEPPASTTSTQPFYRQRSIRWVAGLGLLGLLIVGVPIVRAQSATADADAEQTEATTARLPVETITAAEIDSYGVSRTFTGEISAFQASDLGFENGGQLVELLVPEGSFVSAGQPIARLDTRNLITQRMQIEAEKARALAQMNELVAGPRSEDIAAAEAAVIDLEQQIALQRTQLARREFLYERGAISQEALDEFSFGEGSLQARLNQARSQLQELENGTRPEQLDAQDALLLQFDARLADIDVTLSKSTLRAPYAGTVARHVVDEGTVLGAGQAVVRLVEEDLPEARIGIPADTVSSLTPGSERTVIVDGEQYTAILSAILPEVDSQTRTQTAVFDLEARAAERVNPGQTVRLNLTEQIQETGIWLPADAITQGIRGLWSCYVLVDDRSGSYTVRPESVEVIHQESDRVLVTGTLQPGEQVVASGAHRLVPGQQVTPQ